MTMSLDRTPITPYIKGKLKGELINYFHKNFSKRSVVENDKLQKSLNAKLTSIINATYSKEELEVFNKHLPTSYNVSIHSEGLPSLWIDARTLPKCPSSLTVCAEDYQIIKNLWEAFTNGRNISRIVEVKVKELLNSAPDLETIFEEFPDFVSSYNPKKPEVRNISPRFTNLVSDLKNLLKPIDNLLNE